MKKVFYIITGAVLICIIVVFLFFKLKNDNMIRLGSVETKLPSITQGEYIVGRDIQIKNGKYAIYAQEGEGEIIVNEKKYNLDNKLYNKAKEQVEYAKNAVIYEESPKVELNNDIVIKVKGTKDFKVSFAQR